MCTTLSSAPSLDPTPVEDVALEDGYLTWTASGLPGRVNLDEVLFVLHSTVASSAQGFVVCFLEENAEDKRQPFALSALRASGVPDQLRENVIHALPPYLFHGDGNQVDVVISAKSGLGLAPTFWKEVLSPLWRLAAAYFSNPTDHLDQNDDPGKLHRITLTQNSASISVFARDLWNMKGKADPGALTRTIVLLSGDGGVVDLLNGTDSFPQRGTSPSIALLPLGTGNALFHSMHKPLYSTPGPSPLVIGLRTLFTGAPMKLPIFKASFSPGSHIVSFSNRPAELPEGQTHNVQLAKNKALVSHLYGAIVASYGLHASIVYESDTPEYRVHGDKRFGMVAQNLLRESHPYAAQVFVQRRGTEELSRLPGEEHAYVLTTLVSNLERKFAISPASRPLQGPLRIVQFGPIGSERTMDVMMKAYDEGSHVNMAWPDGERVTYEEVEKAKVVVLEENERWRKMCIDGTIVEVPKNGEMTVRMLEEDPLQVIGNPRVQVS